MTAPEPLTLTDGERWVERLLATHGGYKLAGRIGEGWACWCGEHLSPYWPKGGVTPRDTALDYALRGHVAVVLADRLAADRAADEALREAVAGLADNYRVRTHSFPNQRPQWADIEADLRAAIAAAAPTPPQDAATEGGL